MEVTRSAKLSRRRPSVGFVGTFPPTQCGIATFTAALAGALAPHVSDIGVVEVIDRAASPAPPPRDRRVTMRWSQAPSSPAERSSRVIRAAHALDQFDLAIVQHEYGIFGGPDGDEVLSLLARRTKPTIIVLHTIPAQPSDRQRALLEMLVHESERAVVMSGAARRRLLSGYRVQPERVVVIPHGAPDNLEGSHGLDVVERHPGERPVVLTWGLLGPGKGIEHAITAMASLTDLRPAPRYLIAGETHPKVALASGEAYRSSLQAQAEALGCSHLVEFDAEYRDIQSLMRLVRGADVVLLPYESREQVTSGVLIEAVTSGRPVVATAFPHAVELLGRGAGIVVQHNDPTLIAAALRSLLTDRSKAAAMAEVARRIAPSMFWSNVGLRYAALIDEVIVEAQGAAA